jgi:hypothetical protein
MQKGKLLVGYLLGLLCDHVDGDSMFPQTKGCFLSFHFFFLNFCSVYAIRNVVFKSGGFESELNI